MEILQSLIQEHWLAAALAAVAGLTYLARVWLSKGTREFELRELYKTVVGALEVVRDLRAQDPERAAIRVAEMVSQESQYQFGEIFDALHLQPDGKPDVDPVALAAAVLKTGSGKKIQRKVRNELQKFANKIF